MEIFKEFCDKFKPLFTATTFDHQRFNRWIGFEFIASELLSSEKSFIKIIETGTCRTENDWLGFGQSTLIFDWMLSKKEGQFISVDNDMEAIRFARTKCKNVNFVHADSIGFLRNTDTDNLSLLYLDTSELGSWELNSENKVSMILNSMTELGSIWKKLPPGCLIAVNDCYNNNGKHTLIKMFFEKIVGIYPAISSHLTIWRKPCL